MALPAGVTTFELTFGQTFDFQGVSLRTDLTITPSHEVRTAAGERVVPAVIEVSAPEGEFGSVDLPQPGQDDLYDLKGNLITNWWYTITGTDSKSGRTVGQSKVWKVQPTIDQLVIDLDVLPTDAVVGPVGSVAPPAVTSVNGAAGAVVVPGATNSGTAVFVTEEGPTKEALTATIAEQIESSPFIPETVAEAVDRRTAGAFGARTIVLGDSIDANGSGWWFDYLCINSSQRVTRVRNAGIGGNRTDQMLARLQTDVIDHAPQVCIFGGTTNDQSQGIAEATTRANIVAIYEALRAEGIKAVVRTTPPVDNAATSAPWNTVASRRAAVQRHNAWLRQWAASVGVPVFDMYAFMVDPATGGLKTAYAGDGIHPSQQAHAEFAAHLIAKGLPDAFQGSVDLATSLGEDGNCLFTNNGVFVGDANADGVADGWSASSAVTKSLVTGDATIVGNWQRVTIAGGGEVLVDQYMDAGKRVNDHVYGIAARIKTTSSFRLRVTQSGGPAAVDIGTLTQPLNGVIYLEVPALSPGTNMRFMFSLIAGGTGTMDLAQVAVRDRTLNA